MYIITHNDTGVIQFISETFESKDDMYILKNGSIYVRCPKSYGVLEVESVPAQVNESGEWCYNESEGFFKNPSYVPPVEPKTIDEEITELRLAINGKAIDDMDIEELRDYLRNKNNSELALFLKNNPLLWDDGKYYGVTKDDQDELTGNLTAYNLKIAAGVTNPVLEWHSVGAECTVWDFNALCKLAIDISNYVIPYIRKCQKYKVDIINASTKEELLDITIDFTA